MGDFGLQWFILVIYLVAGTARCDVSTKMDFGSEGGDTASEHPEDVEVKHTIVLSTKLTNNNRRGFHGNDGKSEVTYNVGKADDDTEVPIVRGFKAVESTRIRTPDTRNKPKYPEPAVLISRNLQDGYNLYPEFNPSEWKPSPVYHNINWWESDSNNIYIPPRTDTVKFQRKITDESMKEFYCKRCRELSQGQYKDCFNTRRNYQSYQTTTPKVKIDGKLAKLN